MKRILALAVASLLLLAACSGAGPAFAPTASPASDSPKSAEPTVEPTADSSTAPVQGGFTAEDLVLQLDGQPVKLAEDIAPLLQKLGDGYELEEAQSCLYAGMDKTFTYPGITILTYPMDGKDVIDEIDLTDATYKTPKGVSVGQTMDDIVAAYGSNYYDDGGIIIYTTADNPADVKSPRLYFTFAEGKINLIGFYSGTYVAE